MSLGGAGVLTRKDNAFTDIWNYGFDVILRNGEFKAVCEAAAAVHGQYYIYSTVRYM